MVFQSKGTEDCRGDQFKEIHYKRTARIVAPKSAKTNWKRLKWGEIKVIFQGKKGRISWQSVSGKTFEVNSDWRASYEVQSFR